MFNFNNSSGEEESFGNVWTNGQSDLLPTPPKKPGTRGRPKRSTTMAKIEQSTKYVQFVQFIRTITASTNNEPNNEPMNRVIGTIRIIKMKFMANYFLFVNRFLEIKISSFLFATKPGWSKPETEANQK